MRFQKEAGIASATRHWVHFKASNLVSRTILTYRDSGYYVWRLQEVHGLPSSLWKSNRFWRFIDTIRDKSQLRKDELFISDSRMYHCGNPCAQCILLCTTRPIVLIHCRLHGKCSSEATCRWILSRRTLRVDPSIRFGKQTEHGMESPKSLHHQLITHIYEKS